MVYFHNQTQLGGSMQLSYDELEVAYHSALWDFTSRKGALSINAP